MSPGHIATRPKRLQLAEGDSRRNLLRQGGERVGAHVEHGEPESDASAQCAASLGDHNGVNAAHMRTRTHHAGGRGDELSQCAAALNAGRLQL